MPEQDTVKKRRPKRPLESYHFDFEERVRENMEWTIDRYTNHIYVGHIDTLQNNFQRQYPFMRRGVGSAFLGNYGAPSRWLSYFDDDQFSSRPSFADAWGAYLRTVETMPFYNVKKPFSQLGYVWAGQRMRQEEDFTVIHAQNITPSTGFNVNYRSFGTRGIYRWQATRDKVFSAGVNHTGKRYTLHAGYIHNKVYNRENGGLVRDDDVLVDIGEFEQDEDLPMRMSDPKNWVKSNTYFVTQSYGLALRRVTEQDFTIADRPAVFLGHSLEYSRWARKYEDTFDGTIYSPPEPTEPDSPYYDNWHFNPEASRDSLFEGRLSNRIFVQIQPWNRSGAIGTIDAGVGMDVRRYYQFSPDQYLVGSRGRDVKETEYYLYAQVDGNLSRYFSWKAHGQVHPFGAAEGDMEVCAEAAMRLFVKQKPMTLSGRVSFSTLDPTFWEENFSTNHFIWNNSFGKEKETRINVGLEIPHIGLEARINQSVLTDKIYYGPDAVPLQNSGTVSVTGVYIREDVKIPIKLASVNFNHRVQLQWSGNQQVVPVPMAAIYLSYFWEFNVVRDVLRLQVGFDARYNTKYYAPGYNPAVGQFYNQREKELGNYPWVDLFVNAKWKRMRIIIKMEHLNDDMFGSRNYFGVLHYPTNRRVLKLGLSWNMYD